MASVRNIGRSMHILIFGAAGMVGRKLTERLAKDGALGGRKIARATLHDVGEPQAPVNAPFAVRTVASDFALPGEAEKLVAERPDVIFHLAATVSAAASATPSAFHCRQSAGARSSRTRQRPRPARP